MPFQPTAKTGSAEIKQLGQTETDRFGKNPSVQVKGAKDVRNSSTK